MQASSSQQASTKAALIHSKTSFYSLVFFLFALLLVSIGVSVSLGQVDIPLGQAYRILLYKLTGLIIGDPSQVISGSYTDIIWSIRFPRVILALLVGAGLSLCGMVMQATVQNPLADPYILGISSGASLGATFAILVGFGATGVLAQYGLAFGAFIGAFGASLLVLTLASLGSKMTSVKLVLSGMVMNALCLAFSNFIVYFANNAEGIRTVTFWTMGSLATATWSKLPMLAVIIAIAILAFLLQTRILNTMLLGDEAAVTLGINLASFRKLYLLATALITGIIVANCGMIGFVGLIIPHIVRGMVGSDHRKLLPITVLFGSIFLVWADVLARTVVPSVELPIGIITAMIGAPMFMYMLIKKGYSFGGK